MQSENEVWKDIEDFKGYYQVSNKGRVRGVDRYVKCGDKTIFIKGKIIAQNPNHKGYLRVRFSKSRKERYTRAVHRLVAKAFIPNPKNYDQVNHIDGVKIHNNVENLEWCNNSYNQLHAVRLGLNDHSLYDAGRKKVKVVQIEEESGVIINIYNSYADAKRLSGIEWKNIKKVCQGERKRAGGYQWAFYQDGMKVGDNIGEYS